MDATNINFFKFPNPSTSHTTTTRQLQKPLHANLKEPPAGDLRWMRVEQWLAAKSLAANTKRSYIKELKRFWHWTEKPWNQITTCDVTRYKDYLEKATAHDPRATA